MAEADGTATPQPWPEWARWLAGGLAAVHLGMLALHVFAGRSGPWAVPGNLPSRLPPPPFAHLPLVHAAETHLGFLRLDETGRFPGIFATNAAARLEAVAPDGAVRGQLPEANAWFGVRARQRMLANALLCDVPALPDAAGERSYPSEPPPRTPVWRADGPGQPLKLVRVPEHELNRSPDQRELGPSAWQWAVAGSVARRLGGADATLRRHWTMPLPLAHAMGPPAANPELARTEFAPLLAEQRSDYGSFADAER